MTRFRAAFPPATPPEDDRRVLRLCLVVATLFHGALLFLPVPWSDAAAAPEAPPRLVHRLSAYRPPPPPDPEPVSPPPETRPPRNPVPVPEGFDDDPRVEHAALPAPDLESLAEFPVFVPEGAPPPPEPATDDPVYVVGEVVPPEPVFAPPPEYPGGARLVGREGIVVLQATIDREGRVTDVEVLRGAPLGLTEAALDAVRRWRFRPATRQGLPVAVYYQLTVRFHVR